MFSSPRRFAHEHLRLTVLMVLCAAGLLVSTLLSLAQLKSAPPAAEKPTTAQKEPAAAKAGDRKEAPADDDSFDDELTARRAAEAAVEARLEKILDAETSLEIGACTPLREVVRQLRTKYEIDVRLDEFALEEINVGSITPVTLHGVSFHGISLRAVLRHLMRQIGGTFVYEAGSVILTSSDVSETSFQVRVYPVQDLVVIEGDDQASRGAADELVEMIAGAVQPDTWDTVGGAGHVECRNGLLIVSQTYDVHQEVIDLLATLRELPALNDPRIGTVRSARFTSFRAPGNARIERALNQVVTWETEKTTLAEFAKKLKDKFGIEVQLDTKALEDVGLNWDMKVSVSATNITLRSALRRNLESLDLTYYIQDEILLITTPEVVEAHMTLRVYPVFDLLHLPVDATSADVLWTYREFMDTLAGVVRPNTWDAVGGPGSMQPFSQRGALLVAQTIDVHEDISDYFLQLREAAAKDTPAHPAMADAKTKFLVVYQQIAPPKPSISLDDEALRPDLREFEPIIRAQVTPDSWKEPDAYLAATADRIVVRHTRSVQRKVEALLGQLGIHFNVTSEKATRPSSWHPRSLVPPPGMGAGQ